MRTLAILVVFMMLAVSVPTTAQNGELYRMILACPDGDVGFGCPVKAEDGQDMMGDPSLAVDPFDTDRLIMASLHGSGDSGGPTVKSRSGQAFTTFTSTNHGLSWTDNPFTPPPNLGFGAYGEHPQVTIDPFGFVYIGSLYAVEDGGGGFDYVIAAQNFTGISNINRAQNGVYNVKFIPSLEPKNVIEQFWYLYHPADDIMNMVWWERPPEASSSNQEVPLLEPGLLKDNLLEREEEEEQGGDKSGAIGIAWKNRRNYYGQDADDIIKPCDSATNPVRSDGMMYVGCRVGAGHFKWDDSVDEGQFVLFRMNPDTSNLTYMGKTPLHGGHAKLGARSDGRLAIANVEVENGRMELFTAYGSDTGSRVNWNKLESYGDDMVPLAPNTRLMDANIQSLIYREYSGVIHLILKQVTQPTGTGLNTAFAAINPNIAKTLVAIDEVHGVLAKQGLDIGNPINRTDPDLLIAPEPVYNDISDGFLQMPIAPYRFNGHDLGMYSREFIAYGDYGIVQFAEVIELTDLRGGGPPGPPSPPSPLPSPATSLTATQILVPAAGITIAGLMAASFAINRSTSHNAAAAKGKK